ncbi:MAG: cyclic nucleotide-binding domain-containing protein [Deltaproteobacteria bacterium]|nr:cyclic nucleotide-binding domain-containing protein [Deltaproteobacteria bacterium]
MTREQLVTAVAGYLRGLFGSAVELRDVRLERRVAGSTWVVTAVIAASSGDITVADLEVDEQGILTPALSTDDLVDAVRRWTLESSRAGDTRPSAVLATVDLFRESLLGEPRKVEAEIASASDDELRAHTKGLLARGDEQSLRDARDLMPRLLVDPELRAETLLTMAELERRLGERKLALGYLEAAAREFADRFDLDMLERCAAACLELVGKQAYPETSVHGLLERSLARLRPLPTLWDAPSLAAVTVEQRTWLDAAAVRRTLAPGEILVREGDPSRSVYIIRSGVLAVVLETPGGAPRRVRCCFPGGLLGESSVLSTEDPRCTATLRAERLSEVWVIDAGVLGAIMSHNEAVRDRIAATKQIHRIDSFFSMHETMGQLDVQVRDEMLGCIKRILTFDEDTVVVPAGEVPAVACLVARGELALHSGWDLSATPAATIGPDTFFGVRDALHQIPSGLTAVATKDSTVALFDAGRLRALGERSPDHVVAVLERLG